MTDVKKRLLAALLAGAMIFGFAGCGDDDSEPNEDDAPQVGS